MPEKKRNREFVIVAAAVLGIGASACDLTSATDKSPPAAASNKGKPAPKPQGGHPPPGSRMGK